MDRDGVNDAGFRPCIYINICEHDCTLWLLTVNIWKLYVHCSWRSDPRSYEHYWTNSWNKAWKIFQARSGFEPMTFAIPLQRSTNWANMPNGSWSMFWVQIKPSKWWLTTRYMKIIFVHCGWRNEYRSHPRSYEHYWTSGWGSLLDSFL